MTAVTKVSLESRLVSVKRWKNKDFSTGINCACSTLKHFFCLLYLRIRKGGKKMDLLKRLIAQEEGQDIVEYALMLGLVVLVIWVAAQASGVDDAVSKVWSQVKSSLNSPAG